MKILLLLLTCYIILFSISLTCYWGIEESWCHEDVSYTGRVPTYEPVGAKEILLEDLLLLLVSSQALKDDLLIWLCLPVQLEQDNLVLYCYNSQWMTDMTKAHRTEHIQWKILVPTLYMSLFCTRVISVGWRLDWKKSRYSSILTYGYRYNIRYKH